jgi:hypothetical protein
MGDVLPNPEWGRLKEEVMRKRITLAAAAALFSAAALLSGPTQAMPFGSPSGVLGAAEAINPIEKTACWRYGWHGWGWYPCGYVVRPGYGYYGGWRRGYGYGWRGRGWRRW